MLQLFLLLSTIIFRITDGLICYHCMSVNGTDPTCEEANVDLMGKVYAKVSSLETCITAYVNSTTQSVLARTAASCETMPVEVLKDFYSFCKPCTADLCNNYKYPSGNY